MSGQHTKTDYSYLEATDRILKAMHATLQTTKINPVRIGSEIQGFFIAI